MEVRSRCILVLFGGALGALTLEASDYYVAPNGTPAGPGSISQPYALGRALSGQVSQPGDTFWLRGGDYKLGHVDTKIAGAPGAPVTFRQMPGESVRIDGSLTFYDSDGHVIFRDFELYNSDTNRFSSQTNSGFDPPDLTLLSGIGCYAHNLSFINLTIHDHTRHGIYASEHTSNTLIYGCIVFNNGWASPDNAEGHGLYIQGVGGNRTIGDSLVFNNSGANMHVYENEIGKSLVGVTLTGNVAFNAGAIQTVRSYRDWLVGVDLPGDIADRIVLSKNMGYHRPELPSQSRVQIGRDSVNGSVVLKDNYLPLPITLNNWHIAVVQDNVFSARAPDPIVILNQSLVEPFMIWDRNLYSGSAEASEFIYNQEDYHFSEWQEQTMFDQLSTFQDGALTGTKVFVRSNAYEVGRAHIVVYNWDHLDHVTVDVSSVLPVESVFEVRNAQNLFGPPVLTGVFDGQPLELPMTNLTVAAPNGPLATPPSTAPTFNVFVLLRSGVKLQVKQVGSFLQVAWSTNYGLRTLQYTDSFNGAEGWINSSNSAVAMGDQFIVTEPANPGGKFYRLQIH